MLNKTFEQAVTDSKRHCLPSIFLLLLIIGVLQPALATEAPKIPMTASRWQIKGDVGFEQDKAKQDILVIEKGYVQLKHIYFRNGTIEFDVKFVGSRITGLTFHQFGETADALYSVRQQLGQFCQFCLTGFETPNLVLELNAGHTIQNGLNRSIKVPLDAFQLFALTDDVCATLNPQRLRHKYTGVLRLNRI